MEDAIIKNMDVNRTAPEEFQEEIDIEEKVRLLNQDPTLAIISNMVPTYEDLNLTYQKYSLLPKVFKRLSNQYSMQFYGYNVPNMYALMRAKFVDNDILFRDDHPMDESVSRVMNDINEAVITGEKEILESLDLSSFSAQDKAILDYEINEAKREILENSVYDFSDFKMVPWFTLSENYCKLEHFEDPYYINKVIHAMSVYKVTPTLENCRAVLDLGWNPSIPITKESVKAAKKRQSEWLNEHKAIIYDLTKTNIESVNESTKAMRDLYKEYDIYPVYIVLSWNNTLFGKLIKFVKDSKYTHAGLTLDSDLAEIVTFKYDQTANGFNIENLKRYINTFNDCQIEVLCLFVDKRTIDGLKKSIKWYRENSNKTKYAFKNLFSILLNKKKEFTKYDTEMVCSQFVDQILKLNGIDVSNKANNLVIPQDYATIANKNPRVYRIFEGFGKDYYDAKAESVIKDLIETKSKNVIMYKNESGEEIQHTTIPLELAIYTIDKE